MLKDQTETDDIIILTLSGRLEKADVEQAMRRLDTAFGKGGKVHIFAEVLGLEAMSVDALWSDISHGLRYLARLSQFGRIAIVSDQSWVRMVSRIESALLPFVTYEVFTPGQRDHALAWVKGEVASPRPESLHILDMAEGGVFAFEVNGRITRQGIDALHDRLSPLAREGAPIRMLALIRHFDGFDPSILTDLKYLELKLSIARHVSRYAVVGGPDWLAGVVKAFDPLLHMDIRHFALADEQAARQWVQG